MPWERIFEWWPIYKKHETVEGLKALYVLMSRPENIEKMIYANDVMNKPPIIGLKEVIEDGEGKELLESLDLKNDKNLRRMLGSMVGEIIYDYGYRPYKQKNISSGGSSFFKSATHYQFNEDAAIKKLQKEVVIENRHAVKDENNVFNSEMKSEEYRESLKKFYEFWKKYGLTEKVKSILTSFDLKNENRIYGSSSLGYVCGVRSFASSIFPLMEQLSGYSSGMFLNVFQIAALLENEFPGIIELSGFQVLSVARHPNIILSGREFVALLSDVLLEKARGESSVFEAAYMFRNYLHSFTVLINGENKCYYAANPVFPMFRIRNGFDFGRDAGIRDYFARYNNDISEEFFDKYNVMDNIEKILKKTSGIDSNGLKHYCDLYQLAIELSLKRPIRCHYYPIACIFFELLKRIFNGKAPRIKAAIWPGNFISELTYLYYLKTSMIYVDGLSNYTPLFVYDPASTKK